MLCMQRKESSYTFLEKDAYAVPIGASLSQFHMYPRCSQLLCLPKRATNNHTFWVKQKAPIQHHNFLKRKK